MKIVTDFGCKFNHLLKQFLVIMIDYDESVWTRLIPYCVGPTETRTIPLNKTPFPNSKSFKNTYNVYNNIF